MVTDKESLYENLALELRRGILVVAVLAHLHRPAYGYSLKQALDEDGIEINEGTLYPLLRRLESQGLLQSEWQVEEGQRPRRYYILSPTGATVLSALQSDWDALVKAMQQVFAHSFGSDGNS